MDLSALAEPKPGRAVSGLTRTNVALIRSGLWCPSDYFADRSSLRSLAGHRPRFGFWASPLANGFYLISSLEQSAVAQHGMHDDGQPAGERDTSLLEATTFHDLHGPSFQSEGLLASGQDRVRRFVQQLSHRAVTLLGDPASPVDLTGFMTSRYQPKVRTGVPRLSEASSFINSGSKRCR